MFHNHILHLSGVPERVWTYCAQTKFVLNLVRTKLEYKKICGFTFKNRTSSRLSPNICCGQVPISTYVPAPLPMKRYVWWITVKDRKGPFKYYQEGWMGWAKWLCHLYFKLRNPIVCLCDSVTSNSLSVRDSEQGAADGGPEASNIKFACFTDKVWLQGGRVGSKTVKILIT